MTRDLEERLRAYGHELDRAAESASLPPTQDLAPAPTRRRAVRGALLAAAAVAVVVGLATVGFPPDQDLDIRVGDQNEDRSPLPSATEVVACVSLSTSPAGCEGWPQVFSLADGTVGHARWELVADRPTSPAALALRVGGLDATLHADLPQTLDRGTPASALFLRVGTLDGRIVILALTHGDVLSVQFQRGAEVIASADTAVIPALPDLRAAVFSAPSAGTASILLELADGRVLTASSSEIDLEGRGG
jgi:hypothetical protein